MDFGTIEVNIDDVRKFVESSGFTNYLLNNTTDFNTAAFILDTVIKAINKVEKDFQPINPENYCIIGKNELTELLASSYRFNALENNRIYDWDRYGESIHNFLDNCSNEDGVEYKRIEDLADAEVEHYLTLDDVM